MDSVVAIGQPDYFFEVEPSLDAAQLSSVLADVDRNGFLGEDSTIAVGTKDSHLRLDLFGSRRLPMLTSVVPGKTAGIVPEGRP
jgi:hypothetical protein